MEKRDFKTVEQGAVYELPMWEVVDGKGIEKVAETIAIPFVRGSKIAGEKVEKKEGVLHETLLCMMIKDLKFKQTLVPSREGALAITNLEQALHWMEERQRDRQERKVEGTYKK